MTVFKANLQISNQPAASYDAAAVLLTNCLSCLRGNLTAIRFKCPVMRLHQYLGPLEADAKIEHKEENYTAAEVEYDNLEAEEAAEAMLIDDKEEAFALPGILIRVIRGWNMRGIAGYRCRKSTNLEHLLLDFGNAGVKNLGGSQTLFHVGSIKATKRVYCTILSIQ